MGMKDVLRTLTICVFACGQISATAHSHEHDHNHDHMSQHEHEHPGETEHSNCEVCILAIDENEAAFDDLDLPDEKDRLNILYTSAPSDIGRAEGSLLGLHFSVHTSLEARQPDLYLDAPRAPPMK